jgi:hypothetical protein
MRLTHGLLAMALLAVGAAQAHATTIRQYDAGLTAIDARLARAIAIIEAGRPTAGGRGSAPDWGNAAQGRGNIPGEMPAVYARKILTGMDTVQADDGAVYPTDKQRLLSALDAADKAGSGRAGQIEAYRAIENRIAFLRADMITPRNASSDTPPRYLKLVRSELSRSEFAAEPTTPPNWLARRARAFSEWVSRMIRKLTGRRTPGPGLPAKWWTVIWWIICAVAIIALFSGIVWLIVQLIGQYRGRAAIATLQSSREEALVEARDTVSLIALAERNARAGDYRAAFRLVYLATLVALDTGGVLRFDRSKTNWEYVRALRRSGRPEVYDSLLPLTREFDRIWYGQSAAGPDVYLRAVAEYERLENSK